MWVSSRFYCIPLYLYRFFRVPSDGVQQRLFTIRIPRMTTLEGPVLLECTRSQSQLRSDPLFIGLYFVD
jgi:hypothetical protein